MMAMVFIIIIIATTITTTISLCFSSLRWPVSLQHDLSSACKPSSYPGLMSQMRKHIRQQTAMVRLSEPQVFNQETPSYNT